MRRFLHTNKFGGSLGATLWDADYMAAQAKLPAVSALKTEKNAPRKYELGRMRPDGKPGFNTPTGKIELFSTITSKFGFEGLPVYT